MSLMVSISGIRGVVGTGLTPETVTKYCAAFSEYCQRKPIVIGRDGRSTGTAITNMAISVLQAMGSDVIDIGIVPTPTVQMAVEHFKAAGGIAVTASHNPMQWNGLKFLSHTGLFLDADENKEFWRIADTMKPVYKPWDAVGTLRTEHGYIDEHMRAILALDYIDIDAIRKRKLKVVVDAVNAAGGLVVPKLLRTFGCDVVELNCDVSGVFSHTPEPLPENLTQLAEAVRREHADIGIAVDPDVDRLVLIDERGEPYGEEYTVTSVVKFVLAKEGARAKGAKAVVNLSTTRAVDDVAAALGAEVVRTPVGEINVARRMRELGAIVGGEGSGGVILPKVHLGRDAPVGIALVLQMLTEFGGTVSALRGSLPSYFITKGKVELGTMQPDAILARLQKAYEGSARISTADGLKLDFPTSWVHLRKSNTEPIVRIIAEAPRKSEADELVKKFTAEILAK